MQIVKSQQIKLEDFEGSLDLLLQLVKRSEIPIEGLTLQHVVSQLLAYIEQFPEAIEDGAEALAPAASLLLLKSRYLLPAEQDPLFSETLVSSPPAELMQHVIDYCHFRQAASFLGEREEEQAGKFARLQAEDSLPLPPRPPGVDHLNLRDLVDLVEDILKRSTERQPEIISEEEWRVSDAMDAIRADLGTCREVPLTHYFCVERARGQMIVLFLAILEMMRLHELRVINGAVVAP